MSEPDFNLLARRAHEKVLTAIYQNSPITAKEWLEVAAIAAAAAKGEWEAVLQTAPDAQAKLEELTTRCKA